jgi:hypothetical protein
MSLDVKVISFVITTATAGNTITVTPGFETKAAILFWSGITALSDGNGANTHRRGVGCFVSASSFACVGSRSVDGGGSAVSDSCHRTDACIVEQGNGSMTGWADVQSISSTQVVFEILDQFSAALVVTGIFFGGSEVTGAEIVPFTATGVAPVDQEVSTTNVPKAIFTFWPAGAAGAAPATAVSSTIGIGIGTASSSFVWAGGSDDGGTSGHTDSYLRTGDLIVGYNTVPDSAIDDRATLSSFTVGAGNGFTINWAARANALRCYALVLSGTFQTATGSFTTQTDTTTDMTGTTSFTPKGMLFLSHNKAQNSAGGLSAHDKWSMGVATATSEQHCHAVADRDGNTLMFVSTALEQDHIYVNMDEVNQTLQGRANLTAVSATGFTARMTDADPAGGSVCWLALGDAPAATTSSPFFARTRFYSGKRVM